MAEDRHPDELPRRVRGSARTIPGHARPAPPPPAPVAPPVEPSEMAASAASLARATRAAPPTPPLAPPKSPPAPTAARVAAAARAAATAPPAPHAEAPPPAPPPPVAPPPPAPPRVPPAAPPEAPAQARRPVRRWQVVGLAVAILLFLVGILTVNLRERGPTGNPGSQLIATEAAVRGSAASWITAQVGRDEVLACDAVMCAELAQRGFPAGNLNVLQPTAPDPYGSQLLIATGDIRSQFGSKLAFFAPTVIASFGTGAASIDVRVIAVDGAAAYDAALASDLRARINSGMQLLRNSNITVTAAARAQLTSGEVDARLLTTIAFLAGEEPVSIVAFGSFAPGAAPGVPARWVYLAVSTPRAGGPAYLRSLEAFIADLRPPYVPIDVTSLVLPDGQQVLRIEYSAPSPLGLLSN